jgi:hypothetical protein
VIKLPLFSLLATTVAAPYSASTPPPPQTYFSGSSRAVIPLTQAPDGQLFLTAKLQDQPVVLLVDTGASQIVDASAARKLGLTCTPTQQPGFGMTGTVTNAEMTSINMQLGGIHIWGLRATCLDLTQLRAAYQKYNMPMPDAVLSAEVLAKLRARIDFEKSMLELKLPTRSSASN